MRTRRRNDENRVLHSNSVVKYRNMGYPQKKGEAKFTAAYSVKHKLGERQNLSKAELLEPNELEVVDTSDWMPQKTTVTDQRMKLWRTHCGATIPHASQL